MNNIPLEPFRRRQGLRILFVAQAVSIHTARWIAQLQNEGWDLHLFDMLGSFPHPELRGITEYSLLFPRYILNTNKPPAYGHPFFLQHGLDPFPLSLAGFFIRRIFRNRAVRLANLIHKLQPDIVHSIELQTESYHLLDAIDLLGGRLHVPWVVTTWGSDIYYFQRFPNHLDKIKRVLLQCDYLIPDCTRDVELARQYGFVGEIPLILPGSGGYPLDQMRSLRTNGAISDRRIIMLKGYQGWAGRAMNALEAIQKCDDLLANYEIIVYSASPEVHQKVKEIRARTGLNILTLSRSPHQEILMLFGKSRLAIGINETDGLPNSLLEAMTMGAFPIQSDTQSTTEWITDSVNGLLVEPNDPDHIARAIRKALMDNALVDRADVINERIMAERLDLKIVKPKVIEMYRNAAERAKQVLR